jgi:Zn-finger nucleic acid-binding protein
MKFIPNRRIEGVNTHICEACGTEAKPVKLSEGWFYCCPACRYVWKAGDKGALLELVKVLKYGPKMEPPAIRSKETALQFINPVSRERVSDLWDELED